MIYDTAFSIINLIRRVHTGKLWPAIGGRRGGGYGEEAMLVFPNSSPQSDPSCQNPAWKKRVLFLLLQWNMAIWLCDTLWRQRWSPMIEFWLLGDGVPPLGTLKFVTLPFLSTKLKCYSIKLNTLTTKINFNLNYFEVNNLKLIIYFLF